MIIRTCPECRHENKIINEDIRHKLSCNYCKTDLIWDITSEKEYRRGMLVVYLTLGVAVLIGFFVFWHRSVT